MKIGFIGLGIMGSRMASNLIKGGHELIVYNRSKHKALQLIQQGALWAENLKSMADTDIVFTMLAHPEAVLHMATGVEGFLEYLKPGTLWVDSSTVHPSFSRQMAAEAAARSINFLDAPVAGTKPQAQNGELVFFVGGEADDLNTCRPYLELMGKKIIHVGGYGMGISLKVVINLLLASSMASFSESMVLGQALGLSQELLFNILLGGPVVAPFLTLKREKMEKSRYEPEFSLQWMKKDIEMAIVASLEAQVELSLATEIQGMYYLAMQAGLGEQDFSAIYQFSSERSKIIS